MKKTKSLRAFYFLIVSLLLCNLKVNAIDLDPFEYGDYIFAHDEYNPNNVIVIAYYGSEEVLNVPESIMYEGNTYSVIKIGSLAYCQSQVINIPNSIIEIGSSAFVGCEAREINLPNNISYIGTGAFASCPNLEGMVLPESLENIEPSLFLSDSSLKSVIIPNGITSIGESAFSECESLSTLTIPNSVTFIGMDAFYRCISLESIVLSNKLTQINSNIFACCFSLNNVQIPESVTQIDSYAFDSCTSLTSITIPKSVEHIFEAAFFNCTSLMNVFSLSTVPPYCHGSGLWDNFYPECETAILHVPVGTKEKYEETPGWADFKTIVDDIPLEDAGIEDILSGECEGNFEIFSIDGKLITKNSSREYLKTLPKGIYIIGYGKNKYKISI